MVQEVSLFKKMYLVTLLFNIIFFAAAWSVPTHTTYAEYYAYLQVAGLILILIDIAIAAVLLKGGQAKQPAIFDTATVEVNNPKYLLQRLKVPIIGILIVAFVFGLLWGGYYMYDMTYTQKPFLFVPDMYSTLPTAGLFGEVASAFDVFSSSLPVAIAEETVVSALFATLLGIGMLVTERTGFGSLTGWGIAAVVAILLTSAIFSYGQHAFTPDYQANRYAYEAAFMHGAVCTGSIALTGTNVACITSHAIHNAYAKSRLSYQQFTVVG